MLFRSVVHRGSTVEVTVRAWDDRGQPRAGAEGGPRAAVGTFGPLREGAPGVLTSPWTLPERGPEEAVRVEVRVHGPAGGEPARLRVWAEAGVLYAGVTDLAELPVPEQPLRVGDVERVTGADGTVVLGPVRPGRVEVAHARWPGLRRTVDVVAEGGPVFPLERPLVSATAAWTVRLAPAVPVNVRLKVEGTRVTFWLEDASGQVLRGRRVHVALSAGERDAVVEAPDGRSHFTVRGARPVSVSVADVATGVTALAEVRP